MVALQFGQRPAFGQFGVEERKSSERLQPDDRHRDHTDQPVPRGEVRLVVEVFVVDDGAQTRGRAAEAQTLQDPVQAAFSFVLQLPDGRRVRVEQQDGFGHEKGKLDGGKKVLSNIA